MTDPMLAMLRRDETDLFLSECKITDPSDGFVDADGNWQPPTADVYSGPCQFHPAMAAVRDVESAGEKTAIHPYRIKVPANTDARVGHVVQITACPDAQAVDRAFTVMEVPYSQWQVSRVLECEEAVR